MLSPSLPPPPPFLFLPGWCRAWCVADAAAAKKPTKPERGETKGGGERERRGGRRGPLRCLAAPARERIGLAASLAASARKTARNDVQVRIAGASQLGRRLRGAAVFAESSSPLPPSFSPRPFFPISLLELLDAPSDAWLLSSLFQRGERERGFDEMVGGRRTHCSRRRLARRARRAPRL